MDGERRGLGEVTVAWEVRGFGEEKVMWEGRVWRVADVVGGLRGVVGGRSPEGGRWEGAKDLLMVEVARPTSETHHSALQGYKPGPGRAGTVLQVSGEGKPGTLCRVPHSRRCLMEIYQQILDTGHQITTGLDIFGPGVCDPANHRHLATTVIQQDRGIHRHL